MRIIEVATREFAAHGFDAVSMRHLAGLVPIDPGTLYEHIGSKQALLWDIVRDVYDHLASSCAERPVAGEVARAPRATVTSFFEACAQRADVLTIAYRDTRCLSVQERAALEASRAKLLSCLEGLHCPDEGVGISAPVAAETLLALGAAMAADTSGRVSAEACSWLVVKALWP
jgi:AcrR family transcriptional regulator